MRVKPKHIRVLFKHPGAIESNSPYVSLSYLVLREVFISP